MNSVSDEELFLRERAIQLGEGLEVDCVGAVVQITQVLLGEGLNNLQFEADDARRLRDDMRPFLTEDLEVNKERYQAYERKIYKMYVMTCVIVCSPIVLFYIF